MATPSQNRPAALKGTLAIELSDDDWRVLGEYQSNRLALERAIAGVPGKDVVTSLQRVAARLPLATAVEFVGIRLRESEGANLHLLASEGSPARDLRRLSLEKLSVVKARSILTMGAHHSVARTLGLRWLGGEWLIDGRRPIGVVFVGSRTERRPADAERELLQDVAVRLTERLRDVDRSAKTLGAQSRRLAREAILQTPDATEGVLSVLRPRELVVLDLYADGLAAQEIADLLVISPHTVRTHIKLAFRRLGVSSREEAAEVVRSDQLLKLL